MFGFFVTDADVLVPEEPLTRVVPFFVALHAPRAIMADAVAMYKMYLFMIQ